MSGAAHGTVEAPPETSPETRPPLPTVSDVARRCGVATSTVSRALSRPGRVSEATRARVMAAAAELNYQVNPRARSLQSGRTETVALLMPDVTNPFFFGVVRGMQHQCTAAGYAQLLVDTQESAAVEARELARLPLSVDGLVLAASRLSDDELAAAAAHVPVVTLNRRVEGIPSVVVDSASGMTAAVEHLASLGHRALAYAAGPSTSWSDGHRWRAIETACRRLGLSAVRTGPFAPTVTSGAAAAAAVLNTGASAVIAFNDVLAIGVLQALRARGVDVPGRVSVVGCDDIFGADFCVPSLTTLTAPIERAGRVAMDMLLDRVERAETPGTGSPRVRRAPVPDRSALERRELLPTHLTIRESTGPAPRQDTRA